MARVSLSPSVGDWPFSDSLHKTSVAMKYGRPNDPHTNQEKRLGLSDVFINKTIASANLNLKDNQPTPLQIGDASRYLANIAGQTPEQIVFHIRRYGLKGTDIELNRTDLEHAFLNNQGSSEEIWQTTQFIHNSISPPLARVIEKIQTAQEELGFKIDLINDISLSENDSGCLYRTGLVGSLHKFFGKHFFSLQSLRFNLSDNLQTLSQYRGLTPLPVRSDIDVFTAKQSCIGQKFSNWICNIR